MNTSLSIHIAKASDNVWKTNGKIVRFGKLHSKVGLNHFVIGPFLISWTWWKD